MAEFEVSPPHVSPVRLDELAPDFAALTTHGPIRLSDFRGRWVVLFSHPADFTPVCTTEFVEFARRAADFQRRNVQLIGLSIDGVQAHIAWVRNMEEKFGVNIWFPVIADLDMRVAMLYGMIHPGASTTSAVRCVFIIDDKQVVRTILYYPLTTGRNIDEILRVVDALQTTDTNNVATPANWRLGDMVLVKPPATQADAVTRMSEPYEVTDWYFAKRKL